MAAARWVDAHTPTLSVVDSRDLVVRSVAYCRHPLNESFQARVTRNHFDSSGRLVASWDPRLRGTAPKPNLVTTYGLQGQSLLVESVDAGWQLSLLEQAGVTCSLWDGRGGQRHTEYDELLRPIAVTEQMTEEVARVSERFTYGDASDGFVTHNQCGQLIRHDHPAGRRSLCEYGVGGLSLAEQTRFLRDLEPPDWSSGFADAGLEDEVFETTQQYAPLGEMRSQTDAMDNFKFFAYDQAGQLRQTRLKLADSSEEPRLLVDEIRYDAFGRSVSERAGNGVITIARYADEDGRLMRLWSRDADGKPLQDFNYDYDPVGNIADIEDKAQLTRHFNNQRIDPVSRYRYDSLYQLIEVSGSEVSQPSYGPALPVWQTTPLDPNQLRSYTQTFNYDAAGNLQTRHHSGSETFEMFTALDSNRSVADKESLADGFDANGNQRELLRGQRMSWDIRNQLSSVTLVRRDDGPDDAEYYCYDSPGHRLRKVRLTQAAHRTLCAETRYLPNLEIHRDAATGEERHVITVEAGRNQVRALHWVTKPRDVRNDQLRFCLSNHLNSSTLELNEQGGTLSREVYYAFGGTALWAGASEAEGKYKTIRYSGKELDAMGLYYYGYRYYAPWLQRWVSPDPAGLIDGLNIFGFVLNNPLGFVDREGLAGDGINEFLAGEDRHSRRVIAGSSAVARQQSVLKSNSVYLELRPRQYIRRYSDDSDVLVNNYLRYKVAVNNTLGESESTAALKNYDVRINNLVTILDALPHTGNVTLYRGGSSDRGTSGEFFRQGRFVAGNTLVNTDFSSFTESPYVAAGFALSKGGEFDNSSVIFEVDQHFSPKPVAPFSSRSERPLYEAESLVAPAAAFNIISVNLVEVLFEGVDQDYVHVLMREVVPPKVTMVSSSFGVKAVLPDNVYDMRTGEPIDFDSFSSRLGTSAERLLKDYH